MRIDVWINWHDWSFPLSVSCYMIDDPYHAMICFLCVHIRILWGREVPRR